MPTGYTADIAKGITFQQFAIGCARAFGACVTMRGDPSDKPIPNEFKPSPWHKEQLSEAYQELDKMNKLTIAEAERMAVTEFTSETKRQEQAIKKDRKLMNQYKDMLYQVKQWQPPTLDHIEFKNFMMQQLESSIKFDGMENYYIEHSPQKLTGKEWLENQRAKIQRDIDYHTKEDKAGIERTNSRTAWIKALRESLA